MNVRRTIVRVAAGCCLIALGACAHQAQPGPQRMAPLRKGQPVETVDAALDYTVIPAVTLQGADVMAALSAWARESRGHNSHRTPFFYACSVATPAPGPDGVVPAPARITLSLKNVTSRRLLDEICRQGGLVWWVERKTIMIGPPGSAPGNRP